MKRYLKEFLMRGALFGGLGPIVAGVVYLILSRALEGFSLGGDAVFIAILSTYLLAFLQAGASVFYQIEHWSMGRSLLCHSLTLYFAYAGCYLVNAWIPFEPLFVAGFTALFAGGYFVIWLVIVLIIKATSKKMNAALK